MVAVAAVFWVWFLGIIVAGFVIRVRAGVGVWRRPKVFGPDGFGLGWTMHSAFKAAVWPITLSHWLANDRPEPRVVFNEKARQREALSSPWAASSRSD
jgi:hypothetical protein